MFLAALILIVSTALLCFYIQVTCQRILRREFDKDYSLPIVNANRLEFALVPNQGFPRPLNGARTRVMFRCDFQVLRYLLKGSAHASPHAEREELLLSLYFRVVLLSLTLRHWLRLPDERTKSKLTAVLRYLANLVGQRVERVRLITPCAVRPVG